MDAGQAEGRRIGQVLRASLLGVAPVAVLLLAPAGLTPGGTWVWFRGLALVGGYGAVSTLGNLALAIWRPAHYRMRQQSVVAPRARRQPRLDAVGTVVLIGLAAVWLAFIPIDVFRLHLLPAPTGWVSVAGAAAALAGAALWPMAIWENRFATPNVQDQTAEGQHIVDTGIYRFVRHPIYLGTLLLFGGAPLWLGSSAAVIGVGVLLVMTVGRIVIEERDLRARLPAYKDYARRVRGRLIPFVI
jgi:protein-S-isoprenylcysteine O-methyltransferase Ste14